ncbi:MAG: tetratricopeptide repeat protein [Pseudobdellovibrio sp.]
MKNILHIVLIFSLYGHFAHGQEGAKSYKADIDKAVSMIKSGKNLAAAQQLLAISKAATIATEKARVKYLFGLSLMELNLNQTAAFQFVEVIRAGDPTWTKPSIEKLLIVTDRLGDETLLNFAIQRVDINQIPVQNREMLYFRLAEIKHKSGQNAEAVEFYSKVTSKSRYFFSALYNMGLAQAEANQPDLALQSFKRLLNSRAGARVTDTNRVAAQMGIARVLYQKQDWAKSIEAYSKIPRDHVMWHDALFEKTWAMLRTARFRSTLSNFQSLHSSYYEDTYLPETLLLRAIVYLYICQYDEMEKVLSLYEGQYNPALKRVTTFLQNTNSEAYFTEISKTYQMKKNADTKKQLALPYNILKHIAEEGDVRRTYAYLRKINEEKKSIEENAQLRGSSVGSYATRIVNNRINSAKTIIGELVKNHLTDIKAEITDLNEQSSFIRYEMINGKKETLKKRIAGKSIALQETNATQDRSFYIQNGYEYYPFQGEYWLDEIGNYHYLGKQSCE